MTGKLGTRILELLRYGLAPRAPAELAANFTVFSESARYTRSHTCRALFFAQDLGRGRNDSQCMAADIGRTR